MNKHNPITPPIRPNVPDCAHGVLRVLEKAIKPLTSAQLAARLDTTAHLARTACAYLLVQRLVTSNGEVYPKWSLFNPSTGTEAPVPPRARGGSKAARRSLIQRLLRIAPSEAATTSRIIAEALKINPDSTRRALIELQAEGLICKTDTKPYNWRITAKGAEVDSSSKAVIGAMAAMQNKLQTTANTRRAERAELVLAVLREAGHPMIAKEICLALDFNKTTTHRALLALLENGQVQRNGNTRARPEWSLT